VSLIVQRVLIVFIEPGIILAKRQIDHSKQILFRQFVDRLILGVLTEKVALPIFNL
jgi:hypothetical protein